MKLLTRFYMAYLAKKMENKDSLRLMTQMKHLPLGVVAKKDIPYIDDGKKEHLMDIYYPYRMEQVMMPTIIDIHGGGFIYGYKEINQSYNMHLAEQGYTVISLNYRLLPAVNLLEQLQDILAAFRHIEEHLDRYPCNKNCMFLTGDSAGALLALYAYSVNKSEKIAKAFGITRSGLDFLALGFTSGLLYTKGSSIRRSLDGLKPFLFPRNYLKHPFYPYMNPDRLTEACKLPPCYLQTSRQDIIRDHTLEFEIMLTRKGVFHRFRDWDASEERELSHVFPLIHPEWEESAVTIKEMCDFFRKQIHDDRGYPVIYLENEK